MRSLQTTIRSMEQAGVLFEVHDRQVVVKKENGKIIFEFNADGTLHDVSFTGKENVRQEL